MRLLTGMAMTIFGTTLFVLRSDLSSISQLPSLSQLPSMSELPSIAELPSISLSMMNMELPVWLRDTPAPPTISAAEASRHLGELITVCGRIASEHIARSSPGAPTCIHFEKPYPDRVFTVLVPGSDRASVGAIPSSGMLCATGIINASRGKPEIVVKDTDSWYVPQ